MIKRDLVRQLIYLISGSILIILASILSYWAWDNTTYPVLTDTAIVTGVVEDSQFKVGRIEFVLVDSSRKYTYYRPYGNFNSVNKLIQTPNAKVELVTEKNVKGDSPRIYQISINGIKLTDFIERGERHGEYINSLYWASLGLFLLGFVGIFMSRSNNK